MTAPAPFDYRTLDDFAEQAAAAVLAVWLLREDVEDEEEWRHLVVTTLVLAALQAEQWGRLYGEAAAPLDGAALLPDDGKPRRPPPEDFQQVSAPAPPPDDDLDVLGRQEELFERLAKSVDTLADEAPDGLDRVERLARDEPIQAAQRGFQDGMRLQPEQRIVGYRRGVNPGCCELCWWLLKDGYVYPLDQPMHRHTGCRCVPVPASRFNGRAGLSAEDEALLTDLYAKYKTDKRRPRNG
jgi:hypothetical protein